MIYASYSKLSKELKNNIKSEVGQVAYVIFQEGVGYFEIEHKIWQFGVGGAVGLPP